MDARPRFEEFALERLITVDRFIGKFGCVADRDLMVCAEHGVAYQADFDADPVEYGQQYFDNYVKLEGQQIARKLNTARVCMVDRWIGPQATLLDVGIGSGEFIKTRGIGSTFGFDVNPNAERWLRSINRWADDISVFENFSCWDVIEHMRDPYHVLRNVPVPGFLFTSIPIFGDITKVRESRHYKPGEHLYYFTEEGFVSWLARYGFKLVERNDEETKAGRDSILSFAFRREWA